MKTALLVVDIQNDYFPGGKAPLPSSQTASEKAAGLLDHFRRKSLPVIHIRHESPLPAPPFFLKGSPGAEIHTSVQPRSGEKILVKHFANSFRETELLKELKEMEVERLVICGMMTQMCVHAAARAAADHGFQVIVASDACAARHLEWDGTLIDAETVHRAFLAALSGFYARVISGDEIMAQF